LENNPFKDTRECDPLKGLPFSALFFWVVNTSAVVIFSIRAFVCHLAVEGEDVFHVPALPGVDIVVRALVQVSLGVDAPEEALPVELGAHGFDVGCGVRFCRAVVVARRLPFVRGEGQAARGWGRLRRLGFLPRQMLKKWDLATARAPKCL
jgi:hypothetical protein